jgi:phosphoserine aminotransferase
MERVIENCVAEKSAHFVNGTFAKRFYQIAASLKKHPQLVEAELGQGFPFAKTNLDKDTELFCFTHTETSGGTALALDDIYEFSKKYPEALVAIDIVSSIPYVNLDISKFDCVLFSVQKGMGLPAGLGVLIVSPKALRKAESLEQKNYNTGSYHNFKTLQKEYLLNQTIETPNVLDIYLLNEVLRDMLKAGVENIRKQTEEKAALLYNYFEKHKKYQPFVTDKKLRSNTVIVIGTPDGSTPLLKYLKTKGFVVGSGYGEMKEKQIRIANFPAHTLQDMKHLLEVIKQY